MTAQMAVAAGVAFVALVVFAGTMLARKAAAGIASYREEDHEHFLQRDGR